MKRLFDIILALILLVPATFLMIICFVLVKITSPGPALFRQTRVGMGEQLFTCLKLRTMRIDTREAPSHETAASAVTSVGRWLRRLKLDELPQLWNIIRGDMSFVGPRPCLPLQTELIAARRTRGLYTIRPGVTGVSQVAGIDMANPERLASYDATYLESISIRTDLRLIVATALGAGRGDRIGT